MNEATNLLFARPVHTGGNGGYVEGEMDLAKQCPSQFRSESNPWREAVSKYRSGNKRGVPKEWLFKSDLDENTKSRGRGILLHLLERRGALPEKLQAVAAWMMSELLGEPPK